MDNFLAKFKPENKVNVGVSVSPTAGLEMIMVDPISRKVTKYAHRQLAYNFSNREIEDYNEFKILLNELFVELKIKPNEANVVLNLPSVKFGHTYLPTTLEDDSVTVALTAEVEQSYLFKKNEPAVSWQEVKANNTTEKRYILYAAIQKGVVDVISDIFTEIGATLIAVENTYSSLMKTLEFTGLTKDFVKTPGPWNMLLVSQNSFAVFSMIGYNIIEHEEDPLAVKSFNGDEVYVAITQAASTILEKYPADKLLIISESSDVSAEILALQLKHPGEVIFLECNQYSNLPIMEVDLNVLPDYVKNITPEAIGAAIYRAMDFSIKMNFVQTVEVKNAAVFKFLGLSLTKEQVYLYAAFIMMVCVAIGYVGSMLVGSYTSQLQSKKEALEQEATELQKELAELQSDKDKTDIFDLVKNIDDSMVNKVLYYNALGANIPAKVWVTAFYADTKGAYGIEGQTTSVDDVYLFYRNIKSQVNGSDMIVSKLSVDDKGGMIDIEATPNANYSFALSNPKYSPDKLSAPAPKAEGGENSDGGNMEVPNLPNLPN